MKSIKDHWLIHHLLFHFTLPTNPLICLKSQQYFLFSKSCLFFLKSHLLQGHFQYRNSIEGKAAYTKIPPLSAPRNNQLFLLFLSIHFVEIDCLVFFFTLKTCFIHSYNGDLKLYYNYWVLLWEKWHNWTTKGMITLFKTKVLQSELMSLNGSGFSAAVVKSDDVLQVECIYTQ